jgi:Tfp pilus assembly PilM family ATPase
VLSVSSLTNAIKDLWRTAGIKSKVVITSVAGTGALVVRVIEVPKMTDGELRDNMKVDADRYIPFRPRKW